LRPTQQPSRESNRSNGNAYLRRGLGFAVLLLALAMLGLTVTPAEVWKAPAVDAVYSGFDPSLISTTGDVDVTRHQIEIGASRNTFSTINFATTLRDRVAADIDVKVLANEKATQVFRFGIWSPWTRTGYFVDFGPPPDDRIDVQTVTDGQPGSTLLGGATAPMQLGQYYVGETYHLAIRFDRIAGRVETAITGSNINTKSALLRSQSPAIFGRVQVSLSASVEPGSGMSHITATNYTLTLLHQRSYAAKTDDAIAMGLLIALVILGGVAVVLAATTSWPRIVARRVSWPRIGRAAAVAASCVVAYVAGNAVLFQLGGHPFDFANEQFYAYVAKTYGPVNLYFLPEVTSAATSPNEIPWIEAGFPYEAVMAYLFTAVGWIGNLLIPVGAALSRTSQEAGYVIKTVNVLFGLADTALIYLILRDLKVTERWSRIGALLFLFNPAVWFSMSVWGQTHVASIFLVLGALLFAQKGMPFWAWLALVAACLTRPQMLVFGALLGVVLLRKFSWRENLAAVSWTILVTFLCLAPLTLLTSPSLPVDVMVNDLRIQEAGGNQASLATVSQGAFSIWPLVTYATHGASGVDRAFVPSGNHLIGSLTYQSVSQALTVLAILLVIGALLRRNRSALNEGGYLPLVAIGVTSFLMLLTGVVATHFLLALPFLLLCRKWMDTTAYLYVVITWTITTLVPMYGEMGAAISSSAYPLLAADHNGLTQFFVGIYEWDRFITVAIVANVCAVLWLVYLSFRPVRVPLYPA